MNTNEVWVVFNTQINRILHVYAYEVMAANRAAKYYAADAPITGTVSNIDKISVMTLNAAIMEIEEGAYMSTPIGNVGFQRNFVN